MIRKLVVLTAVPVQGLFAAETFTRSACMVARLTYI